MTRERASEGNRAGPVPSGRHRTHEEDHFRARLVRRIVRLNNPNLGRRVDQRPRARWNVVGQLHGLLRGVPT